MFAEFYEGKEKELEYNLYETEYFLKRNISYFSETFQDPLKTINEEEKDIKENKNMEDCHGFLLINSENEKNN